MSIKTRVTELEKQSPPKHSYQIEQVTDDMTDEEAIRMYQESIKLDKLYLRAKLEPESEPSLMTDEEAVKLYQESLKK